MIGVVLGQIHRNRGIQIVTRFASNAHRKPIRNHNDLKFLPKEEMSAFMTQFPKIVEDATHKEAISDHPLVNRRLERFLNYYGPSGKFLRQHILIYVYKMIENHYETFDQKNMEQVHKLGWCLELFNLQFMLVDDLLDNHDVRKGKKAWHKLDNIGVSSMIDSYLVQTTYFRLLKKYFSSHPNYVYMLENFSKLDLIPPMILETGTTNLNDFTLKRHMEMGIPKCGGYIMGQPFELATLLANKTPNRSDMLKNVFDHFGSLYSLQNDMLDCYGEEFGAKPGNDIQENRCAAPIVLALRKASPQQLKQLEECYGTKDDMKIKKVKQIYEELDVLGEYYKLEKDIHDKIAKEIENVPDEFTRLLIGKLAYIYTFGEVGIPHV